MIPAMQSSQVSREVPENLITADSMNPETASTTKGAEIQAPPPPPPEEASAAYQQQGRETPHDQQQKRMERSVSRRDRTSKKTASSELSTVATSNSNTTSKAHNRRRHPQQQQQGDHSFTSRTTTTILSSSSSSFTAHTATATATAVGAANKVSTTTAGMMPTTVATVVVAVPQPSRRRKVCLLLLHDGAPASTSLLSVYAYARRQLSSRRVADALPRWFWLPALYAVVLPLRTLAEQRLYVAEWGGGAGAGNLTENRKHHYEADESTTTAAGAAAAVGGGVSPPPEAAAAAAAPTDSCAGDLVCSGVAEPTRLSENAATAVLGTPAPEEEAKVETATTSVELTADPTPPAPTDESATVAGSGTLHRPDVEKDPEDGAEYCMEAPPPLPWYSGLSRRFHHFFPSAPSEKRKQDEGLGEARGNDIASGSGGGTAATGPSSSSFSYVSASLGHGQKVKREKQESVTVRQISSLQQQLERILSSRFGPTTTASTTSSTTARKHKNNDANNTTDNADDMRNSDGECDDSDDAIFPTPLSTGRRSGAGGKGQRDSSHNHSSGISRHNTKSISRGASQVRGSRLASSNNRQNESQGPLGRTTVQVEVGYTHVGNSVAAALDRFNHHHHHHHYRRDSHQNNTDNHRGASLGKLWSSGAAASALLEEEEEEEKGDSEEVLVVLPLYPLHHSTHTAAALDAFLDAPFLRRRRAIPRLVFVDSYAREAAYVVALERHIRAYYAARQGTTATNFFPLPIATSLPAPAPAAAAATTAAATTAATATTTTRAETNARAEECADTQRREDRSPARATTVAAVAAAPDWLFFVFDGLPGRRVRGSDPDPYPHQCKRLADALADRLSRPYQFPTAGGAIDSTASRGKKDGGSGGGRLVSARSELDEGKHSITATAAAIATTPVSSAVEKGQEDTAAKEESTLGEGVDEDTAAAPLYTSAIPRSQIGYCFLGTALDASLRPRATDVFRSAAAFKSAAYAPVHSAQPSPAQAAAAEVGASRGNGAQRQAPQQPQLLRGAVLAHESATDDPVDTRDPINKPDDTSSSSLTAAAAEAATHGDVLSSTPLTTTTQTITSTGTAAAAAAAAAMAQTPMTTALAAAAETEASTSEPGLTACVVCPGLAVSDMRFERRVRRGLCREAETRHGWARVEFIPPMGDSAAHARMLADVVQQYM